MTGSWIPAAAGSITLSAGFGTPSRLATRSEVARIPELPLFLVLTVSYSSAV